MGEAKLLNNNNSCFNENISNNLDDQITLHKVRERIENFEQSVLIDIQKKMHGMVEDVIQEIQKYELHATEFKGFIQEQNKAVYNNRPKNGTIGKSNKLPDKIFIQRNSFLTDLYEVSHIKSIYNIFFVMIFVTCLNTIIHDYFVDGRINLGLDTVRRAFGKFDFALVIWFCMHLPVFGVYFGFKLWAKVRYMLRKNLLLQSLWSWSCLIIFIGHQITIFIYLISLVVIKFDMTFICGGSLLTEASRLLMKTHAFVRSNVPRQTAIKLKTDNSESKDQSIHIPAFSKYFYFLFAPTLIYRDEYPRTQQIRWKFIAQRLMEIFAVIIFIAHLYERYIKTYFENFGKSEIHPTSLVIALFGMMMPGLLVFLCCFYCVLHSVQNIGAELLRFGDRMFYMDWWTSGNYDRYYRTWNVVVHDWLYEYIYKDVYIYVFKGSKIASSLVVFMVSASIHEFILGVGLRYFYPVMFTFFGVFGVVLIYLTRQISKNAGNIVLWFSIATGNGLMISLYAMEYYARKNCPDAITDNFVITPNSWSCPGFIQTN